MIYPDPIFIGFRVNKDGLDGIDIQLRDMTIFCPIGRLSGYYEISPGLYQSILADPRIPNLDVIQLLSHCREQFIDNFSKAILDE